MSIGNRARVSSIAAALLVVASCARDSSKAPAGARKDILGTEQNHFSQHDEELFIRDFFQDRRDGFFLDVGCAWPVAYSNTYYLESELGWTGIWVDALPEHARRWKNRRPKSKFVNFIVTDHSDTRESFYRPIDTKLLGIATLDAEARVKVEYEEIQIPTITLTELLDQNQVTHLDLLSMDIEGAEPLALAGFDIERFRPELVCVEVHSTTANEVLAYFEAHGYERIERYYEVDRVNFFFAPKGSPALEALAAPE